MRDQVEVEARLADHLGVEVWALVVGGSMGGMRSLEWAVTHPLRVATSIVLASTPYASAEQIAWCAPQLSAIRSDPQFNGGDYYDQESGPVVGLGIARSIAHVTYRSELELAERFGREAQAEEQPLGGGGRYAVESYLDHHKDKLAGRFDANSYLVLTEAMNSHDVGRGRGGRRRGAAAGSPVGWSWPRSTATGSTRRGCPTRSSPPCRPLRRCTASLRRTGTTAS